MSTLNAMWSSFALFPLLGSVARLDGLWTTEEVWLRFFFAGMWLWLLDLGPLYRGETECGPSRLFYLDVLLLLDIYIPHLGDIVLHQIFVERVCELHPADEGGGGYVLVTIVH